MATARSRPGAPRARLAVLVLGGFLGMSLAPDADAQQPAAPGAAPAATSVTVYEDGRVLVRRRVAARLVRGTAAEVRAGLGLLDPATLVVAEPDVELLAARYEPVDEEAVLRRSVGRALRPLPPDVVPVGTQPAAPAERVLLGTDPLRWRLPDGTITFRPPAYGLAFPAELVPAEPTTVLTLRSATARESVGVGYFTSGASWQASYMVLLGSGPEARVTGTALLSTGALALADAEVQLLSGSTGRSRMDKGPQPMMVRSRAVAMEAMAAAPEPPEEEAVGESHLYTLSGRWSFVPGVQQRLPLFAPVQAAVTKRYVVRGLLPMWGVIPLRGGDEDGTRPVEVRYTFPRARGSEFGDRALPAGPVRLYQPDREGRLQLVGESDLPHTAPGRELTLTAGTAFDVTARHMQTAYETRQEGGQRPNVPVRTIATAAYRVTLANAGDRAVTVEVLEERGGEWSVLDSSVPAERETATRMRFRVPVPPKGEATLTYRIRAVW